MDTRMDVYPRILLAGSGLILVFIVALVIWVIPAAPSFEGDVFVLEPCQPLSQDSQVSFSVAGPTVQFVVYPGDSPLFLPVNMPVDIKIMSINN